MKEQPSCAGTGHPSMAGYGRMAPFELAGGPVKRLRTESPFPCLFAEEAYQKLASETLEELDSGCRGQTVFFPIGVPLILLQ